MTSRLGVCLAAVGLTVSAAIAQTLGGGVGPAFWQGSASIAGTVVESPGNTPVRRAIVIVQGALGQSRSVVTDDDGRFEVSRLPSGSYAVTARKVAYLDASYGASRPGRPGTALSLEDGARADITIRMAQGAVLEGVVRDESGEPLRDVDVYALDSRNPAAIGSARFLSAGPPMTRTDDRGSYRLFGLPPGDYVIAAYFSLGSGPGTDGEIGRYADAAVDAILAQLAGGSRTPGTVATRQARQRAPTVAYAPTFYPGTTLFANATRVSVVPGDERRGLDFIVTPVPTAVIEGTVVGSPAQLANLQLSLAGDGPRTLTFGGESRPILDRAPGPDGRFRYTSVPPGHYTIYARSQASASERPDGRGGAIGPRPQAATADTVFAVAEVAVAGRDIPAISLVLRPGATVSGRIVFDGVEAVLPADRSAVRLSLAVPGGTYTTSHADGTRLGNVLVAPAPAEVQDDWSFVVPNVAPGTFTVSGAIPTDATGQWWLRSALYEGRDLLDAPFEIRDRDLAGVVVTWTDRPGGVAGRFETAGGQAVSDFYVVVFPDNPSMWLPGSRRIASTRPSTDGQFTLTRLPSGNYRLIALTDFEPADLESRAFLQALVPQSIPVTIRDGEIAEQNIRTAR